MVVGVIGGTVMLVGIALIVLPGPALVVIPVGLGILGLEFAWARRLLQRARASADDFVNGVRGLSGEPPDGEAPRPPVRPEQP